MVSLCILRCVQSLDQLMFFVYIYIYMYVNYILKIYYIVDFGALVTPFMH